MAAFHPHVDALTELAMCQEQTGRYRPDCGQSQDLYFAPISQAPAAVARPPEKRHLLSRSKSRLPELAGKQVMNYKSSMTAKYAMH